MGKLKSEWGTLDNIRFLMNEEQSEIVTMVCEACYSLYEPNRRLCPSSPEWMCCYLDLPECDHPKTNWDEIKHKYGYEDFKCSECAKPGSLIVTSMDQSIILCSEHSGLPGLKTKIIYNPSIHEDKPHQTISEFVRCVPKKEVDDWNFSL